MELNDVQKKYIDQKLEIFKKSKFRSSFHLRKYMISYIDEKGLSLIEEHAYQFLYKNLSMVDSSRDGHQTPMKGHPVFLAQHACGCCCRKCLYKWHYIPENRPLTDKEMRYLVALVMEWIKREYYYMKGVENS